VGKSKSSLQVLDKSNKTPRHTRQLSPAAGVAIRTPTPACSSSLATCLVAQK